jgi:hypothetical protein
MSEDRVNSFAAVNLADDFKPEKKPKPALPQEETDKLAESTGFPSRQPKLEKPVKPTRGKRYRTGRNQQLNLKVTSDSMERFYKLADDMNAPLGEVFDQAITALIAARKNIKKR